MRDTVLIAHNIRSAHNVGSLLRTAEGLGVKEVYLTGYTPYPRTPNDERLPHIAAKIERQITKTSLGAEKSMEWQHAAQLGEVVNHLRAQGYEIAALEQAAQSVKLNNYQRPNKVALIVGNEVDGLDKSSLDMCDVTLEIPMSGAKESFNVAACAAMALFYLKFMAPSG